MPSETGRKFVAEIADEHASAGCQRPCIRTAHEKSQAIGREPLLLGAWCRVERLGRHSRAEPRPAIRGNRARNPTGPPRPHRKLCAGGQSDSHAVAQRLSGFLRKPAPGQRSGLDCWHDGCEPGGDLLRGEEHSQLVGPGTLGTSHGGERRRLLGDHDAGELQHRTHHADLDAPPRLASGHRIPRCPRPAQWARARGLFRARRRR
jgi:hypothetical protein